MPFEFREVVEGIGPAEFAGVNQAHEDVPDVSAMAGPVKQGVPPMTDRLFQCLFTDVIVQGGSGHAQEQRQLLPVLQQVRDGPAQRRVRLHQPLVKLPHKPGMEFLHDRTALGLMKLQACLQ